MVPWSLTPFSPCIYTLRRVSFRAPVNVSTSGRDARAWVEVDLAAVVENARTVARVAGTRLLPVVKANAYGRSEEHTSELQSRLHLVCRLLLEKKKNNRREAADDALIAANINAYHNCVRRGRI